MAPVLPVAPVRQVSRSSSGSMPDASTSPRSGGLGLGRFRTTLAATAGLLAGLGIFGAVCPAHAVGTRTFDLDTLAELSGGDLRGVAVDSRGRVRAGWNLGDLTLTDASTILSSVVLDDGSVLLGAAGGKVLKVAGGKSTVFADTKQLAVTALADAGGGSVYAATLPKGIIVKIDGAGKTTELAPIVDGDNVLALAYDKKKSTLYAATGPNGKLFAVSAQGTATLLFDSDETSLVSVAVADDGSVYAGSSGKALLFKITGPGRATLVADCEGSEVKAIAPTKDGALFAVCNELTDGPEPRAKRPDAGLQPAQPVPVTLTPRAKPGKGHLYRFGTDGRSEELFESSETHFTSLALDDAGKPYVGTGAEGRVYTVDDDHTVTMIADTNERQVNALHVRGKTRFLVGSDPAMFHEIRGTGGADATWTSKVLDAGLRASFGRLSWQSEGSVEVSTRTGNSATPDATWSEWSTALTAPGKTQSPPGRYFQVRARFAKDPQAMLREVVVPFVTDNARAVVLSIDVAKPKAATTSGVPASGSEIPARSEKVKLTWKVDNPDNDQLRYRVQYRFDTQPNLFRDLTKPDDALSKTEIEWDTSSLPEGTYRVRIEATDELANPPDKVTSHVLESGPILVDNTPPVFRSLTAQGRRVKADIVDGLGPIARIDFAVDGRTEFRPLGAADGILDEPTEQVDVDFDKILSKGNHLVAIRAYDKAGNFVVRDVEVKLVGRVRERRKGRAPSRIRPFRSLLQRPPTPLWGSGTKIVGTFGSSRYPPSVRCKMLRRPLRRSSLTITYARFGPVSATGASPGQPAPRIAWVESG
jgi:hypothetical protein